MLYFCGIRLVRAVNFPYELEQLTESDALKLPAVAFGNVSSLPPAEQGSPMQGWTRETVPGHRTRIG